MIFSRHLCRLGCHIMIGIIKNGGNGKIAQGCAGEWPRSRIRCQPDPTPRLGELRSRPAMHIASNARSLKCVTLIDDIRTVPYSIGLICLQDVGWARTIGHAQHSKNSDHPDVAASSNSQPVNASARLNDKNANTTLPSVLRKTLCLLFSYRSALRSTRFRAEASEQCEVPLPF